MNDPVQLSLPQFIALAFRPSVSYNKKVGSYFLKHRWEEYSKTYAGTNEEFIELLRALGYSVSKTTDRMKLRYFGLN
jgi:hypothetical protein